MFNIITFASECHKWNSKLTPATKTHLKKVEHHLDHLEADGGTNTHDALRMAIQEEDADTIYVLSDGEPTHGITNTRDIINDVKRWISQRKRPITINTIAFLMGHTYDDPKPRQFMGQLASLTPGGVFRCCDPFAKDDEDFIRDGLNSSSTFDQDPNFASFFQQRMATVPQFNSITNQPISFVPMPSQNSNAPGNQPSTDYKKVDYKAIANQRIRAPNDISIPNAKEIKGHTMYTIDIHIDGLLPNKSIHWIVTHPFNEFEKLHNRMKNHINMKHLSDSLKLPPHTIFHHSDPNFVEQRRVQLESYLRTMYHYFNPEEFPDFDVFLMYDLNLSQAIAEQQITDQLASTSIQNPFPTFQTPTYQPNPYNGQPNILPNQPLSPQPNPYNGQPNILPNQPLSLQPSLPPQNIPPQPAYTLPPDQQTNYTPPFTPQIYNSQQTNYNSTPLNDQQSVQPPNNQPSAPFI